MMLIQRAYAVQAFQVVGGPTWSNSEGYDIEAKAEGNIESEADVADAANASSRSFQAKASGRRESCLSSN